MADGHSIPSYEQLIRERDELKQERDDLKDVLEELYLEASCHTDKSKHLKRACEEARQILEMKD